MMKALQFAVLVVTIAAATPSIAAEEVAFEAKAKLESVRADSKAESEGQGEAAFKLSKDRKEMTFRVSVKNLANPTAAHIHAATNGGTAPIVATLFKGPRKQGRFSGLLAEGSMTEKDLKGELKRKKLDSLVGLIQAGKAYVTVDTEAFPEGEISGQLK